MRLHPALQINLATSSCIRAACGYTVFALPITTLPNAFCDHRWMNILIRLERDRQTMVHNFACLSGHPMTSQARVPSAATTPPFLSVAIRYHSRHFRHPRLLSSFCLAPAPGFSRYGVRVSAGGFVLARFYFRVSRAHRIRFRARSRKCTTILDAWSLPPSCAGTRCTSCRPLDVCTPVLCRCFDPRPRRRCCVMRLCYAPPTFLSPPHASLAHEICRKRAFEPTFWLNPKRVAVPPLVSHGSAVPHALACPSFAELCLPHRGTDLQPSVPDLFLLFCATSLSLLLGALRV